MEKLIKNKKNLYIASCSNFPSGGSSNPTLTLILLTLRLSDFLKNYLYIPLGGNKEGKVKHLRNIFIVMMLGGLWHGAGWGFVIWGGLHAIYIFINHFFRYIYQHMKWQFNAFIHVLKYKEGREFRKIIIK